MSEARKTAENSRDRRIPTTDALPAAAMYFMELRNAAQELLPTPPSRRIADMITTIYGSKM